METGPLYPHRKLAPQFRRAVRLAMANGHPSSVLALIAGFSHYTVLSAQLHARTIPGTPLTVARFEKVAAAIGFTGDVFLPEPEGERP